MVDLKQEISRTTYPGRGIVIGLTADGKKAACAYFIMGRSENSRNRVFVEDGVIGARKWFVRDEKPTRLW